MWAKPTKEQLAKIPKCYETEDLSLKDKVIYLHFFIGGSDWYVAEYDGDNTFFGFAILNNDYTCAEWGYFTLKELTDLKVKANITIINGQNKHEKQSGNIWLEVECDKFWKVKTASEIEKIRLSNGV